MIGTGIRGVGLPRALTPVRINISLAIHGLLMVLRRRRGIGLLKRDSLAGTSSYAVFDGTLPENVDYVEKTVYLSVMEDSERWQCAKCVLKIRRVSDDLGEDEDATTSTSPKSCDPNEMTGPEGVGAEDVLLHAVDGRLEGNASLGFWRSRARLGEGAVRGRSGAGRGPRGLRHLRRFVELRPLRQEGQSAEGEDL